MSPDPTTSHPPAAPHKSLFGFWALIATQFEGAFNDNGLKFLVIYLIVAMNFPDARRNVLVLIVGALFALPFLLFSMAGGYLADRYSKRSVTIGTKYFEIFVMLFATAALALRNLPMECTGVFLISTQGALFGPSKYGLLPEILPPTKLSWGNGVIELGTFLASIAGTVGAGMLAFHFAANPGRAGLVLLAATFCGLATSYGITRVPAANPAARLRVNPLGDLWVQVRRMREDKLLGWAVVGNTYLWSLAALLQFVIVIYGHDVLKVDETQTSYLQAAVAIGIGIGSLVAGYLSGPKIEYGLVPLGAAGMTIFSFMVSRPGLGVWHARSELALLGFFGGFYAVPLGALIQHRPSPETKGGVIAASNLFSFAGIFIAAGIYYMFAQGFGLGARQIFFAGAIMTILALLYAVLARPDSLLRLWLWIWTHTRYIVSVEGRALIPEHSGALLIARDLTRGDALLLVAATDKPMHFVDCYTAVACEPGRDGPEETEDWSALNTQPAWMAAGHRKGLSVISAPSGDPASAALDVREKVEAAIDSGDIVCVVVNSGDSMYFSPPFASATVLSVDIEQRTESGARLFVPVKIRLSRLNAAPAP
jgi:acyl-[acyl-carrier-protein]-phospholipid O-acyltransferase / long-chain-fatty-acid--[acyl-carrier-protein] ligase